MCYLILMGLKKDVGGGGKVDKKQNTMIELQCN